MALGAGKFKSSAFKKDKPVPFKCRLISRSLRKKYVVAVRPSNKVVYELTLVKNLQKHRTLWLKYYKIDCLKLLTVRHVDMFVKRIWFMD